MPQKLTLPINTMKMTAGYLNKKYLSQFGYNHYGIDAVSTAANYQIQAIGTGAVCFLAEGTAPRLRGRLAVLETASYLFIRTCNATTAKYETWHVACSTSTR